MACILNSLCQLKTTPDFHVVELFPLKYRSLTLQNQMFQTSGLSCSPRKCLILKPLQSCSYSYSTTLELVKCLLHMIQPVNNDWYLIWVTQPCSQNQKLMDKENTTNSQRSTAPITKEFSNADIMSLNKTCLYMKDLLHASHWCLVYI